MIIQILEPPHPRGGNAVRLAAFAKYVKSGCAWQHLC